MLLGNDAGTPGTFSRVWIFGTSLVVQWLRQCKIPMQGAWVQSLVRELDPICLNEEFACHR